MTNLTTPSSSEDQPNHDFDRWIVPPLKHCWYLTGPTSSGKSQLAVAIAQALDAEIISMDSMAIYRDMDIGTAKPTRDQRQLVPHHQLDIVDPSEMYSLSSYVASAQTVADEIKSRGRNVLVCGGTPLYLKSLLRGLFLGPAADWPFRETIEADIQRLGIQALRDRVQQVDPLLARKLHPNDSRRMIRALEVARATGRPLSHWQEQFEIPAKVEDCPSLVLKLDRAWLHELINERVGRMIEDGLESEVVGLLDKYGTLSRTASQAVGYREMLDHIAMHTTLEETIELIRAHTRQFARRQEIWFRSLRELQPLSITPDRNFQEIVHEAVAFYERYPQFK